VVVVVPITVTMMEDRPPEISIREWRRVMRKSNREMGERWVKKYMPKHWVKSAHSKYHNQERRADYRRKKRKLGYTVKRAGVRKHGEVDNVFQGDSEKAIKRYHTVRGFPRRATIRFIAPNYFMMKPFKSNQPAKGMEIMKVNLDEARELAEWLAQVATRRFNQVRRPRKTL